MLTLLRFDPPPKSRLSNPESKDSFFLSLSWLISFGPFKSDPNSSLSSRSEGFDYTLEAVPFRNSEYSSETSSLLIALALLLFRLDGISPTSSSILLSSPSYSIFSSPSSAKIGWFRALSWASVTGTVSSTEKREDCCLRTFCFLPSYCCYGAIGSGLCLFEIVQRSYAFLLLFV